jgi:acetyltransferase-like isoleucine patch superfamily enzyme
MIQETTRSAVPVSRATRGQDLPFNAYVGGNTVVSSASFRRYRSELTQGLVIGENCTMDGVHFATGPEAQIEIGDYCYFTNSLLLCEQHIKIGNYVVLGWNATIADSDFHPIAPAQRLLDAEACSPCNGGRIRQAAICRAVIIEDDVWIGQNATILKGVRIGRGSLIEPGAMVTKSVPPGSRVLGNPAQIIGSVESI